MTNTLFIGGEWQAAASGAEFETLDPATGQPHAQVSLAGAAEADAAVRAARAALENPDWAGLTPARRARILWRIGDLIEEHAEELAELETRDQGQPLGISMAVSVAAAAEHFRYYAWPRSTARRRRCPSPACCSTPSASRWECAR